MVPAGRRRCPSRQNLTQCSVPAVVALSEMVPKCSLHRPPLFRLVRLDPEQRFELWDFDPLRALLVSSNNNMQCAAAPLDLHLQQPLMLIKTLRTQTQRGRSTWLTGPWEHTYLDLPSETFWFTFTTTFQARCCGWRSALVTSVIRRSADTS